MLLIVAISAVLIFGVGALAVEVFGLSASLYIGCYAGFVVFAGNTLFDRWLKGRRQASDRKPD
ncbi:hypothetical protein [Arthrobacter pityocampae]|uniref:hypothetical protein n=1 Tax=Arthrobacter pityocampae TaxID=547334 RepID=UPI003736550F